MKSGIYKITNTKNFKSYIGASVNVENRLLDHHRKLLKSTHPNKSLQKDFEEKFMKFEVLEFVEDKDKIKEREQYFIDKYQSFESEYGYNQTRTSGYSFERNHSIKDPTTLSYMLEIMRNKLNEHREERIFNKNKIYDLKNELHSAREEKNNYKFKYQTLLFDPDVRQALKKQVERLEKEEELLHV